MGISEGFDYWKFLFMLFTASRREQDNYSGPGSIQMENTYIPELLDGWDLVLQRGLVLLGSALEPVLSFY